MESTIRVLLVAVILYMLCDMTGIIRWIKTPSVEKELDDRKEVLNVEIIDEES